MRARTGRKRCPCARAEIRLNTGTGFFPTLVWTSMSDDREIIAASKAWPIVEAQRLLARVARSGRRPRASCCSRPATARRACRISARSPRCSAPRWCARRSPGCPICRPSSTPSPTTWTGCARCRTTCPNQAMVAEHLGRPLTAIPDPFGTHESYGAHMNARLQAFLDQFGFAYTFKSGSEEYRKGTFNAALLQGARAARRDPRGRAADPGAGAARHLQPDPADLAQDRPRAAGADRGVPARSRARSCSATRTAR